MKIRDDASNSAEYQPQPWLICPNCGQEYDTPRRHCRTCHYFSPGYWEHDKNLKSKIRKRRFIFLLAIITPLVALLLFILYPYFPYPPTFFNSPKTEINSEPPPGDWTVYGHNSTHARYIPSGPEIEGQVRWSADLLVRVDSAPAVRGGTLYVGGNFKFYAFNAQTGQMIWEIETTGPVHSSPAVSEKLVFFGLLDGRVMALDRDSGRLVWEFQSENFIFYPAIVNEGLLFIGSGDRKIYALDASNGTVIWKRIRNESIVSAPALDKDILYFSTNDRKLHSLNARTGARRLCYRLYRNLVDTPVIANNLVYFVTVDGRLHTIRHGTREWPGQYQMIWMWAQLWLWYVPIPPPPKQPGSMWRVFPQLRFRRFTTSPAVTETALYIGDNAGVFYAFDASNGKPLWQFKAGASITGGPLVLANRVYFGDEGGHLYALKRDSGEMIWKLNLDAPIMVHPVYAEGFLHVRTSDGLLYAIR